MGCDLDVTPPALGSMELRYEAKKTLYRIFLDRQHFLDRLPWLLQHVVLSKMPRHYLISLINAVDLTFIILEKIEELDRGLVVLRKQRKVRIVDVLCRCVAACAAALLVVGQLSLLTVLVAPGRTLHFQPS
jgi:hypothetical protein